MYVVRYAFASEEEIDGTRLDTERFHDVLLELLSRPAATDPEKLRRTTAQTHVQRHHVRATLSRSVAAISGAVLDPPVSCGHTRETIMQYSLVVTIPMG
jgi:hypothetical protein